MSCTCENCKCHIDGFNGKMVMLRDELWIHVNKKMSGVLCTDCIELKLGRPIGVNDFKLSTVSGFGGKIPVNMIFAEQKGLNY